MEETEIFFRMLKAMGFPNQSNGWCREHHSMLCCVIFVYGILYGVMKQQSYKLFHNYINK